MKQVGQFGLWVPEDTDVPNAPAQIQKLVEGSGSGDGVNDALARAGALSKATIVATPQERTEATFGTLTTPDEVTGIVLPTKGLLRIVYQATWQETVKGAAKAAIFLGTNQLKYAPGDATPSAIPKVQEAAINAANLATPLATFSGGLYTAGLVAAYTGDVTTGQIIGSEGTASEGSVGVPGSSGVTGGAVTAFAEKGTYAISVKFKVSSGSVKVSNRRLYVWVKEFT